MGATVDTEHHTGRATPGHRLSGRPKATVVDILKKDAGSENTNGQARSVENRDDLRLR